MTPRRGVRPMAVADISAVGRLFYRIFRGRDEASSPDFDAYFAEQSFGSPASTPDAGSIVHVDAEGRITGAIGVVPMQVRAGERILTGRLMSIYMTDPDRRDSGGAELVLTLRPRHQDFCFCDSANAVSADHYKAIGGMVLPIESLSWHRPFRPLQWLIGRTGGVPAPLRTVLQLMARPLDHVLRLARPQLASAAPLATRAVPIAPEAFMALAPSMLARFAVAPVWGAPELGWLLAMATRNTVHGRLQLLGVENARGEMIGASLYYGASGRTAEVLNVLALPGTEVDVVAAVLAHLDGAGATGATGPAQPFLMDALCRQRHLGFRHRGYVCLSTRHPDIRDAAQRGDIYLGGLMGESWSRLLADFR